MDQIDPEAKIGHNSSQDSANALPDYEESKSYRISKSEMQPLNDPKCEHEFIDDPSGDEIGDFKALKCKKCIIGIFVPK